MAVLTPIAPIAYTMSSKSPGISSWGAISLILVIQHLPLYLASSVSAPSCDPLICSCSPDLSLGNCSSKGFLSMPTGLPSQIETLVLSHNDLTAINTTELGRLTDLRQLDLRHNQLSSLFAGVHYSLSNLDLSFNNISSVRALHVEGLVALTEINLANNKIISLPSNAFTGVVMLKSLNLRSNKIVSLEPGCLDKITGLEEFILAKNRLSSVPKGLFQKMKNLRLLELSKNKFVEIQGLSFHGLENLEILKLKRNQIEYLNDGAFFGLHQIQELHLDRNRVNRVDKGWLYGLYTLRTLNLAFNRVNHITDDAWEFCRDLTDLDLRSNLLQLLDRDSLRMLPRLKRLFLQDNLISHIQDEDTFAEVPLVEVLALDGNKISHTIEDMKSPFKGLLHLQRLTLSRNQIKSVGDQAFLGIDDLESIDLRDNVISTIQENAFQHLTKLESLEIDSESILCDCYLKWFPKWVNETRISGCQAKCAHPENLKGQVITSVPYESYTCDDFPKPYILKQPKTQITLKGDDLALSCRAASTSPAEMTFQWKLNSDLISDNLPECPRQPGDESDDSGGSISSSSSSSSGSASHSATTNFKALGRCITNFAHSFDGKGRELTSQLHLTNLTYDDAGKYQCVVANRFGATYSDKANITVYVYPQFLVTSEDITVEGGKTAALKCAAKGVPTPELSWSKDSGSDFPAATERRIKATTYSSGDDSRTNVHNFLIYQVKAEDMGVYQCTASNPAGKISWNVTLSVLEVPR